MINSGTIGMPLHFGRMPNWFTESMGELSKMLGPEWQQTSPESREKYEELAKADRERYETEVEQFNAKTDPAFKDILARIANTLNNSLA